MSKLINENRLFEKVIKNLGNPKNIVKEILQNSLRTNSTKVNFTIDGNVFTAQNDGAALENFISLFKVAETGHTEEVIENENPAGMGIMLLLAHSTMATFTSGSKTLEIDSARFFDDEHYREALADGMHIKACEDSKNFEVKLEMKDINVVASRLFLNNKGTASLHEDDNHFTGLDLYLNGIPVDKNEYDWLFKKEGTGELEGMTFGVMNRKNYSRPFTNQVVWHGNKIEASSIMKIFSAVITGKNHLFKPRFPDRDALINTDAEIEHIVALMEEQLETELREYVALNYDIGDHELALRIMENTSIVYDTSAFTRWGNVRKGDEDSLVVEDMYEVSISRANSTTSTMTVSEFEGDADHAADFHIESAVKSIGATPAPQWYIEMIDEDGMQLEVITTDAHLEASKAHINYCMEMVESIRLNGRTLTGIILDTEPVVTADHQLYETAVYLSDRGGYFEDTNSILDSLQEDLNSIAGAFNRTFNSHTLQNDVLRYIRNTEKIDNDLHIKTLTLDTESKKMQVTLSDDAIYEVALA